MKKLLLFGAIALSMISFGQVPSYVPTSGLVGWWGFNGNANDESGNGNNGTVNGATLTTDRFGNTNSAYDFDGNSNIDIDNMFDYEERSTNIWIKNNDSNWGNITRLAFDNDNINMNFGMVQCGTGIGAPDSIGMSQSNQVIRNFGVLDTWYMCSIIRGADSVRFYFNGVLTSTQTVGTAVSVINYIPTRIGGRVDNTRFWIGGIDDIGIWNRALTECEIQDLYNAGVNSIAGVTQTDVTLTADQNNATYQWIDCDNNNSPISGETNQSYTPTVTGSYAVEVTLNGCVDTSDCFLVDYTGIEELINDSKELVRITDLMGRETEPKPNTPLIYIYSDGTTERVFLVE